MEIGRKIAHYGGAENAGSSRFMLRRVSRGSGRHDRAGIRVTRRQPTAAARFSYSFAGRISARRPPHSARGTLGRAAGPMQANLSLVPEVWLEQLP